MKDMGKYPFEEKQEMKNVKTVVLGVTGSIAAYKIANLTSMLTKLKY